MGGKPQVLTIDRNQHNLELLGQLLTKEGYDPLPISSLEMMDELFTQENTFKVALVDISGFDRAIWHYCEILANHGVQLLVISPQQTASIRQEGLAHGAQNVLFKPLDIKELISIIRSMTRVSNDE